MKKKFFFTLGILLAFIPSLAFAHGAGYLEFNPDKSSSLKVSSVDTPSQVFFAQNDFLGGVDFWVANPGASGLATFALLNDQGSTLTSKTVTIPTIAEVAGGARFHIDFSSQISVLADDRYSIKITSSIPELRLYYSDRVQLVSYNSPFASEYITGVGKLGSEEQLFSFKYTLLETNEVSAPIASNVSWTVISSNEMQVEFNANEPIDYRIEYGPSGQGYNASTNFLGDYQFCASGIATCKLNIPVAPNTNYNFSLTTKDSWGNQSQLTGTFSSGQGQTPTPTASPTSSVSPTPSPTATPTATISVSPTPTPDVSAPIISNLRAVNIADRSADIAWTTNEAANSYVLISLEIDFSLTITSVFDSTLELEHLLGTGEMLNPSTTYLARIRTSDSTGHESMASISFTTLSSQPNPSPTPNVTPTTTPQATPSPSPVSQIITSSSSSGDGTSTGNVQWSPPADGEPKDGYRVDVFDKDGKLVKTVFAKDGLHSVDISELADGEYNVIVYANNDGVFEKITQPAKLKAGDPSFIAKLVSFWPYFAAAIGLVIVLIWLQLRKKPSKVVQSVN